ncbi:MAG: hypothetical protein ACRD2O_18105 [Terriglobia bacterium]
MASKRKKSSRGVKLVPIPKRIPAVERNWCEQCNRLVPAIPPRQAAKLGMSLLKSGRAMTRGNLHLIGLPDGSIRVCARSFLQSGSEQPRQKGGVDGDRGLRSHDIVVPFRANPDS